jgi:DNA polymerase III delta prime subunit
MKLTRLQSLQFISDALHSDSWTPTDADHLIGPARRGAMLLEQMAEDAHAMGNPPIKVLINGNPGMAKSALARYFRKLLKCDKWSVSTYSGTQVKVETIEQIAQGLRLTSLFPGYRFICIEEADKIPAVAQVRTLLLLDQLPAQTAVVCTSNCQLKDFENRFQTRFTPIELSGTDRNGQAIPQASTEEIIAYLDQFPIDEADARHIATFCCGNIRSALLDVQQALQTNAVIERVSRRRSPIPVAA